MPKSSQTSLLGSFRDVLIVPGTYSNVLKSLCESLMDHKGIYLWGIGEDAKSQYTIIENIIKKGRKDTTMVLLYATGLGFIGLGTLDRVLSRDEDRDYFKEFWCDELREKKVKYPYRFLIKLYYISKSVDIDKDSICRDPCRVNMENQKKGTIPQVMDIVDYLKKKFPGHDIDKYKIPTPAISQVVDKDEFKKASAIIEFFDMKIKEGVFVEVPSAQIKYRSIYSTNMLRNKSEHEFIILLHLLSGKNVLLIGPPGSGKTSLFKSLLEKLGVNYIVETGNPDWTPFDTIGGVGLKGDPKEGFIVKSAEECVKSIQAGGLLWLIIDEINRANVDLSFGKFFTLLDPVYRLREPLRVGGKEVWVPLSFRVLATMNSYDRALLFKLGYALTRRFAVISHSYLGKLPEYISRYNDISEKALGRLLELSKEDCASYIGLSYEIPLSELSLCSDKLPNDCITPVDFMEWLKVDQSEVNRKDEVFGLELPGTSLLRLDNVTTCLAKMFNKELSKFEECEVCPVQITPGTLADALKYIAIGVYAYKRNLFNTPSVKVKDPVSYALLLIDSALSSYVIPQLDVLADYARREELQYRHSEKTSHSVKDVIERIAEELENTGLYYSTRLLRRLGSGYHVF